MITALMTVQEAADYCRVDHKTVRRAITRGDLKVERPGWKIRIAPEALTAWMSKERER